MSNLPAWTHRSISNSEAPLTTSASASKSSTVSSLGSFRRSRTSATLSRITSARPGFAPLSHRVRRARELYRQAITTPRTIDDFLRDRHEEADADEGAGKDGSDNDAPSAPGAEDPAA